MKESEKKKDSEKKLEETEVQQEETEDDDIPNEGACSPEFTSGCIYPEDDS